MTQSSNLPQSPITAQEPTPKLAAVRPSTAKQKGHWLFMGLFLLVWLVELHVVQGRTLVPPNLVSELVVIYGPIIRGALDAMFFVLLALVLPKRLLMAATIAGTLSYLGLVTYHNHFLLPLSISVTLESWREGFAVMGIGLSLIPAKWLIALSICLLLKLILLSRAGWSPWILQRRWKLAAAVLIAFVGLHVAIAIRDPLYRIAKNSSVSRLGVAHGYLVSWGAELYYLNDDRIIKRFLVDQENHYEELTKRERLIPLQRRVVVLQAESLDQNIFDFKVNGAEVTPFLNQLRKQSMYFRVRAAHIKGSADADGAVLTGCPPIQPTYIYNSSRFPYQNTLPQLFKQFGYPTVALHGNFGTFYSRRIPFENKLGFDKVFFQEELVNQLHLPQGVWGVFDRDVLQYSQARLRDADREMQFVITMTTHTTYDYLPPGEHQIFPAPRSIGERYLNNMRYLDDCLREYLTGLKETTVLIYGDHPTEVNEPISGFYPDRKGATEYAPCLIYDTEQNLAVLQQTRDSAAATDGTFHLLHVIKLLRNSLEGDEGSETPSSDSAPADSPPAEATP